MTKTISILGSTGSIGLSVFKIIEKRISSEDLMKFKIKFNDLYSNFDFDLNQKIFTKLYPSSKIHILNQNTNFLKAISN